MKQSLLHLHFGTGSFKKLLNLVGFLLRNTLFHGLRSAFHEILRLFKTEVRDTADFLNHLNFLGTGIRENHVKRGFLLGSSGTAPLSSAARGRGHSHSSPG